MIRIESYLHHLKRAIKKITLKAKIALAIAILIIAISVAVEAVKRVKELEKIRLALNTSIIAKP